MVLLVLLVVAGSAPGAQAVRSPWGKKKVLEKPVEFFHDAVGMYAPDAIKFIQDARPDVHIMELPASAADRIDWDEFVDKRVRVFVEDGGVVRPPIFG